MLFKNTVSEDLVSALNGLMQLQSLKGFCLAGGTGLALQLGHRMSVDIDLFSSLDWDKTIIKREIQEVFLLASPERENRWGLRYTIKGIKVELYNWEIPFLKPFLIEDHIRLASLEDISSMKLEAIKERKERKDYYDLAILLSQFTFAEMISFYKTKYPYQDTRVVLDALSAVDEAERTLDPPMLIDLSWGQAKDKIRSGFNQFVTEQKSSTRK